MRAYSLSSRSAARGARARVGYGKNLVMHAFGRISPSLPPSLPLRRREDIISRNEDGDGDQDFSGVCPRPHFIGRQSLRSRTRGKQSKTHSFPSQIKLVFGMFLGRLSKWRTTLNARHHELKIKFTKIMANRAAAAIHIVRALHLANSWPSWANFCRPSDYPALLTSPWITDRPCMDDVPSHYPSASI